MLTSCDDPNTQKQIRRSEQIKKWNERENMSVPSIHPKSTNSPSIQSPFTTRLIKVRFPKGCVFLAACSSGDVDEVKAHLKIGVNINTTNIDGLTALHQACIDANLDTVRFLVENNADINSQDNEGWTPLHAAVSVGNLQVSKYLINKGARLDICNNDSDLPIDLCDQNNQMKEWLEEEMRNQAIDADYERKKEELIMYEDARLKCFEDKVQAKTGATALHVSAAKGYTRVMRILLASGADPNCVDKDGWTPLHAAAHWEQEEACRILTESGAHFQSKTYSDQSVFDVCDLEMVNKLKQLETSTERNNKLTDVSNKGEIENGIKAGLRNRRASDEMGKSSIARLTNEAKSTMGDWERKQEKNLLSPVVVNDGKSVFEFNGVNTKIEPDLIPDASDLAQDKENRSQTNNVLKSNSKTGLQENLKSLSAHVRMMEEDTPASPEQINQTLDQQPTIITINSSPKLKNELVMSPLKVVPNNVDNSISDNRRYSSAPVASKDEQAELIRKQKAKLERHFRRSTTAVSYEDIKSAEATIKSAGSNTNLQNVEAVPNGVSSLSTLFDKPHISSPITHNSTLSVSLAASQVVLSPPTTTTTTTFRPDASIMSTTNVQNSTDTHHIANDIETDKLLNVIEKSKGFSDSKSTQARRLRNKPIVLSSLDSDLAVAKSKVQSLRWNEERLELEVVRKEREEAMDRQNRIQRNNMSPPTNFLLKRQTSGPTLDSPSTSTNDATVHLHPIGRPTYRFGQSDLANPINSRTNIKRSVSQVPSTDRRPLSQTSSYSGTFSSPKGSPESENNSKPIDYQAAYERVVKENEQLNLGLVKMARENEETSKEKRAFDRRISELEEECKKVDSLRCDNNRLKEENAALIRVISKLSK